jgi:hypothetical protein
VTSCQCGSRLTFCIYGIYDGEEPAGLSLAKLIRSFPEEWSSQRTLYGIVGQGTDFSLLN